jgi:hypothetical protein
MRAGFERAEKRGAHCQFAGFVERADLGVRSACPLVVALADDSTIRADDDRADHRIWTSGPSAALGEIERPLHIEEV